MAGRGTLRLLAAIASAATATACSTGQPTISPGQPALRPIPTIRSATDLQGPLDAYSLSKSDQWKISVDNRIADWKCIRHKGLNIPLDSIPIAQVSNDDSYGYLKFLDTATAQRYGYHLPPAAKLPGTDVVHPLFGGIPAAQRAWTAGCQSIINQARSKQFDLPIDPLRGVQVSIAQVQHDTRYLAITRRWSACMARSGYPYKTPFDAMNTRPWGLTDPSGQSRGPVTALEIRAATADAQCRQSINFHGWWVTLLTAYENRLINANQSKLNQAKRIAQAELDNAERSANPQ